MIRQWMQSEKMGMALAALFLFSVFLLSGWGAAACFAVVAAAGWYWYRHRAFSARRKVLLALFLLAAVALAVVLVIQMAPTRYFDEVCGNLFQNPQQYRAIDSEGKDVTEDFVARYHEDYEAGREKVLREAFLEELSAVAWLEQTQNREQGKIYSVYQFHVYQMDCVRAPETRWMEQMYTVKGTVEQDEQTGQVLDYSDPTLDLGEFYGQGGLKGQVISVSVSAEPSAEDGRLRVRSSVTVKAGRYGLPALGDAVIVEI